MLLSDSIYSLSNSGCFRINITDIDIGFGPGLNILLFSKSVPRIILPYFPENLYFRQNRKIILLYK